MTCASASLHYQIEKWFGAVSPASVRIARGVGGPNSRCITVSHPDKPYAIAFFRHGDGSWQVYPPRRAWPTFSTLALAA